MRSERLEPLDDMTEVLGGDAAHWMPLLDAEQRLRDEVAERAQVVAAFLHEHGGQSQCADPASRLTKACRGDAQRALGIACGRVDAERDHDGLHLARASQLDKLADGSRATRSSPDPGASGMFTFAPSPAPAPVSSAKPRKCGNQPAPGSTCTEPTSDVCPLVEELLRAVAVMRVDVEHGNRAADAFDELGGCNRRVVQVAGAAVTSTRGVMAGRPAAARTRSALRRARGRPRSARRRPRPGPPPRCRGRRGSSCRTRSNRASPRWRPECAEAGRRSAKRARRRTERRGPVPGLPAIQRRSIPPRRTRGMRAASRRGPAGGSRPGGLRPRRCGRRFARARRALRRRERRLRSLRCGRRSRSHRRDRGGGNCHSRRRASRATPADPNALSESANPKGGISLPGAPTILFRCYPAATG